MSDHDAKTKADGAESLSTVGLGVWLPIETAPKDGTEILVCGPSMPADGMYRSCAVWREGKWIESWWSNDELFPPTYWTPLPDTPNV